MVKNKPNRPLSRLINHFDKDAPPSDTQHLTISPICDEWIKSIPVPDEKASDEAQKQYLNSKYWVVATKAEAYLGTGKTAEAGATYQEAYSFAPASWMIKSAMEQRRKLELLLADSPLKYVRVGE